MSALDDAIESAVRRVICTATFEWGGAAEYNDLTAKVDALTIDRAITTDYPAEANMVTGSSAAQATITVSGRASNGALIADVLSPFTETVPNRLGVKVTLRLGFITAAAGPVTVPAFVGHIRTMQVSPGGTCVITALDGPESLRTAVTLPVLAGADPVTGLYPGLNAQWVMDYVLRANGYYLSPPTRAAVVLAATLHGSTWPEAGTLTTSYKGSAGSPQGPPTFTPTIDGSWQLGGATHQVVYTAPGAPTLNDGQNLFVEWGRLRGDPSTANLTLLVIDDGTATWRVTVQTNGSGVLEVAVIRNGSSSGFVTITSAAVPSGASNNYVAVHLAFTSTGFSARANVNGTAYGPVTGTVGNGSGSPAVTKITPYGGHTTLFVSGLQVTSEAYSAGMWNGAFVPEVVLDPSKNDLIAMPPITKAQPWPLLVDLAQAEQGAILFDESGIVRFYNRDRMAGDSTQAEYTLASSRALKGITAAEQMDTVRNIVTVLASPPQIDPTNVFVWSANEILMVPANSILIVPVQFDGALISMDTPFDYLTDPVGDDTGLEVQYGTGYRAAQNADGTGGDISNLSISYDLLPGSAKLVVSNPNAYPAYLVNNGLAGTGRGLACLRIVGRLARQPESPYSATSESTASRQDWGDQAIEVPTSVWRQSASATIALADMLLTKMKDPHPVLSGIQATGDPRITLADRITISAPESLGGVIRDYWVVGKNTTLDTGGMSESYTLREAGGAIVTEDLIWTLEPNAGLGDDPDSGQLDWLYGLASS